MRKDEQIDFKNRIVVSAIFGLAKQLHVYGIPLCFLQVTPNCRLELCMRAEGSTIGQFRHERFDLFLSPRTNAHFVHKFPPLDYVLYTQFSQLSD
jgi:hypothetical protein